MPRRHRARVRRDSVAEKLHGAPHDQALKQFFAEMPADAIRFFGGPTARKLPRRTTFELLRQEQVSRILGAGHRITDVVVLAKPPTGGGHLYFLLEGSKHASRDAVFQLGHYVLSLARWLEREHPGFQLTAVLDVIDPGKLDTLVEVGHAGKVQLRFEPEVVRIAELDAEKEVTSDNPVALTNVMNMRATPSRRVALCAKALLRLQHRMSPEQFQKYAPYLLHCARFTPTERVELDVRVSRESPQMIETLFTDYEKKGLAKGRAEGWVRGKADAILRVLMGRGLKVSPAQRKRILACRDEAMLDQWLEETGRVSSVRELFTRH